MSILSCLEWNLLRYMISENFEHHHSSRIYLFILVDKSMVFDHFIAGIVQVAKNISKLVRSWTFGGCQRFSLFI